MNILSRIQSNPEIGTEHADYVSELIDRAKCFICSYCRFPRFPELSKGYTQSHNDASTDIHALSTNAFYLSVNDSGFNQITLDLNACVTGNAIAQEMQSKINASSVYGFDEVIVSFDAETKTYTLTSGRFGSSSKVQIAFDETKKHVCQALKLSPSFGAVEIPGMETIEDIHSVCVSLVEQKFRKLGMEGMQSGNIPGGVSFTVFDLDPFDKTILNRYRRIF